MTLGALIRSHWGALIASVLIMFGSLMAMDALGPTWWGTLGAVGGFAGMCFWAATRNL